MEHLEILKRGVEAWNAWRAENPDVEPELGGADLRDAALAGANLVNAHLGGADLAGTILAPQTC